LIGLFGFGVHCTQAAFILQDRWESTVVFNSPGYAGQIFTAEDPLLASIGVGVQVVNPQLIAPNASVAMSLFQGAGTSGPLLGTRTVQPPLAGPYGTEVWLDFDFSGTPLVPGNAYSLMIVAASVYWAVQSYTPLLGGVPFPGREGHDYTGGYYFTDAGSSPNSDMRFRVVPVPEPSPSALGGLAIFCLGAIYCSRWRRMGPRSR